MEFSCREWLGTHWDAEDLQSPLAVDFSHVHSTNKSYSIDDD